MFQRIGVSLLCAWIGISILPYVAPFRWWSVVIVCLIVMGLSYAFFPKIKTTNVHQRKPVWQDVMFCGSIFLLDVLILMTAIMVRTDDPLISPWERLPAIMVLAYAGASYVLISSWSGMERRLRAGIVGFHALITWGMLEIIFAFGYGFDPFLHRASEVALIRDGAIHPTPLYYMGQYTLVGVLHFLTQLPVSLIDRILVPACAVILASWMSYRDRSPILFLFLLPAFTFTVPYQFAVILGIVSLFVVDWRLRGLWVVLSCLVHPLIGIPFGLFMILREVRSWSVWRILLALFVGIVMISAPLLIYGALHGHLSIPSWSSFLTSLRQLFGSPYRSNLFTGVYGWMYRLVYAWPLILLVAGARFAWMKKDADRWPITISVLSVISSAILVYAVSRFDLIVSAEQAEFAMRLIHLAPLFALPILDRALSDRLSSSRYQVLLAIICAVLMSGVWWNTMPQIHPSAMFYAPSLSRFDIQAVHRVDDDARGASYILLGHQLGSAAAVHEFGFDREVTTEKGQRYYSAIPTGGELFGWYMETMNHPETDSAIQSAMNFAQVHRAYVMIPLWWDPSGEKAEQLRKIADAEIQSNSVWIFRFTTTK